MEMVERYLYAVCKNLPSKSRKDIEEELRSSILDALEARAGANIPSDEDVIDVLKEFGEPKKVARNYSKAGSYLIGPALYDVYFLVLRIMIILSLIGFAIAFTAGVAEESGIPADISGLISNLFTSVFSAIGSVTFIFAVIERVNPDLEPKKRVWDWNPKDLPPVPTKNESVKLAEIVVGMLFTVLFFVILNYYPTIFAAYFRTGSQNIISIPVDLSVLKPYMPFINVLFCLSFIKYVILLVQGRYTARTFILDIIGDLGSLVVIAFLILGPSIIVLSRLDMDIAGLGSLQQIVTTVYRSGLALGAVFTLFNLVRRSMRFMRYVHNR